MAFGQCKNGHPHSLELAILFLFVDFNACSVCTHVLWCAEVINEMDNVRSDCIINHQVFPLVVIYGTPSWHHHCGLDLLDSWIIFDPTPMNISGWGEV